MKNQERQSEDNEIIANPTKRFFVDMLTRDIDLEDAILDLLDNCVDGVVRSGGKSATGDTPYSKYFAQITISEQEFKIEDNCGGIDRNTAKHYAFRMGKPDDAPPTEGPTVGIYGIGMKRAIFKMGRDALVTSQTGHDGFAVAFAPKWFQNNETWTLRMDDVESTKPAGTTITVKQLLPAILIPPSPRMARSSRTFARRLPVTTALSFTKGSRSMSMEASFVLAL